MKILKRLINYSQLFIKKPNKNIYIIQELKLNHQYHDLLLNLFYFEITFKNVFFCFFKPG